MKSGAGGNASLQSMRALILPLLLLRCGVAGDTALWDWSRVATSGVSASPSNRQGHAAVEVDDGKRMYIIGGCAQELQCFNDVHVFDVEKASWTRIDTSGEELPEQRGGHSATAVGTGIYIFGGASSEDSYGDVWRFDMVEKHWKRVEIVGATDARPGRRTNHGAAADDNGRIYVFGGYSGDGAYLDDLFILTMLGPDTATWSRAISNGALFPSPREGHSLTYVDKKLVLFGGYASSGQCVNDAFIYSLEQQVWSEVGQGKRPGPRQAHSAVRHGRDVVVAGGCDVSDTVPTCHGDVWSLSTVDGRWEARGAGNNDVWMAREGHSAIFSRGRMLLFAGCELNDGACFDDVVAIDSHSPCPGECDGHGQCVGNQFCQCTSQAFTGHDCMQPLFGALECGPHGHFTQEFGQCECFAGWTGSKCDKAATKPASAAMLQDSASGCPMDCCDNGRCSVGSCVCSGGWYGPICGMNMSMWQNIVSDGYANSGNSLLQQTCPSAIVVEKDLQKKLALKLRSGSQHGSQSDSNPFAQQASNSWAVRPPSNEDFGVHEVNDAGHTGSQEGECHDNCNFRGICQDKICYCQPGYSGRYCGAKVTGKKKTVGVLRAALMATGGFVFAYTVFSIMLKVHQSSLKKREAKIGYDV